MAKKKKKKIRSSDFHPEWYSEVEVFCEGELIFVIGSAHGVYDIDMWSGIHPFFTGSQKLIDTEGRVDRFCKKYSLNREATKRAVLKKVAKREEQEKNQNDLET